MKALVLRQHGGLENLDYVTDHPMPVIKEGHVIICLLYTSDAADE